ncbi:Lcl domain-containing protein [Vibrio diabolicus]|uniref:Lcl domain-containing protein n=1 Tax=Vibrio diabolicus TaxID=50719 RepID=UPI003753AFC2
MKFQYSFVAMSLALAGCGGGSGGDTSTPTYNVAGTIVSAGTLLDTPVCIDLNQSYVCDTTEPSAKTDNAGKFSLTSSDKNILTSTILAQVDQGSNQTLRLAAPGQNLATGNTVNGVTTLLAGLVVDGKTVAQAEEIVKAQLASVGVSLNGSVMSNAEASELDKLEQNTVALLAAMQPQQMTKGAALLAQSLSFQGKSLVSDLLSEAEVSAFAEEIAAVAEQTVGSNDTGAVLYFAEGAADVAEVQASYPGQDAEYGFDKEDKQTSTGAGFKFVKLDSQGAALAADATEWACTMDERTGLVWENKSADASSIQFKDRLFAFESETFKPFSKDVDLAGCKEVGDEICTTSQYVEYINKQSLCGITGWRLPTYRETYDLLDFGEKTLFAPSTEYEPNNVYGFNVKYFPQQTLGSPYLEKGAFWHDGFRFTETSSQLMDGEIYFPAIVSRGADRGATSFVEIRSSSTSEDAYDSYQFPIRLVAVKGQ